ncbi:MAG: type VI secretion system baseplate subunit TssK [Bryobacteraceae bacterium]|nr:type VI secretion system baseplate subunit TssK [Bryobacteraceae bacterium]
MKFLSRVVWSEGMYLGPHHFQLQSRYFEDSIWFATSALWFEGWGLAGCSLDPEALRNGTVSILHARGVFPDGLSFHMPEADTLPLTRNIADVFPPQQESLAVLLAVPERRNNGVNCLPAESANGDAVRFLAESRKLHDEITGMDEQSVRIGRKNIRLLFDTESAAGYSTIEIARITRDYSGSFIFKETFIPPCIQITASERLMHILQRLIDILEEKSASLARSPGKSLGEFSTREIANFWFLHTVNSALPPLRHLYLAKRGHPEELYTEMARLGGALCTFKIDSHPRTVPLYDHLNLDKTFDALDDHIRVHLDTVVPPNCVSIPLTKAADYFYVGEVSDTRCLGPSRWVLAIRSPIGEVELILRTPQLVKLCSRLFVPELVKRALPGMPLAHLPIPPTAISGRLDTQYFAVNRSGPCLEHINQTRQIGLYVPGEIPDPELELLVILEN